MKRIATFVAIGLLAAMPAFAESVVGIVKGVDQAAGHLRIQRTDDNKNLPAELDLLVRSDAKFKNLTSIQDLQDGNEVKVDVKQNKDTRTWEAKSVELRNVDASAPASR